MAVSIFADPQLALTQAAWVDELAQHSVAPPVSGTAIVQEKLETDDGLGTNHRCYALVRCEVRTADTSQT